MHEPRGGKLVVTNEMGLCGMIIHLHIYIMSACHGKLRCDEAKSNQIKIAPASRLQCELKKEKCVMRVKTAFQGTSHRQE